MTNEEAISVFEEWIKRDKKIEYANRLENIEIYNMTVQALKQQPSEDCISREAVFKIFDEACYIDGDWYVMREKIEKLPSATPSYNSIKTELEQTRWIPVSERLPEANGRYLVTRGLNACGALWNRVYIVNYSDLMGLKPTKIWWNGNVGKSDFETYDDIIAWMPISLEPYKPESEE